jgi:ribosome maturation factor RimP
MKEVSVLEKIKAFVSEYTGSTDTLFLVDLKILPGNKVKVFIDADDAITIEKCTHLNRALYKFIEDSGLFQDGNFSLEVSSPGVDEPLKLHRQYVKNIGRKVEVSQNDGSKLEGTLVAVDEKGISIEVTTGRGKKALTATKNFLFNDIKQTTVLITF